MFRLTTFPAQDGDCLLLSYSEDADHAHHVLIDGGRTGTYVALRPTLAQIGKRGGVSSCWSSAISMRTTSRAC